MNPVNSFFNMYDSFHLYEFWFYLYVYWTSVFLFVVDRDLDNLSSLSNKYYNEQLSIWHSMGADKTVDLSAIHPVLHLMRNKLSLDGLGGFRGVSATITFGARKRIEHSYVKILIFLVLLTLLYSIQTSLFQPLVSF